LNDQARESKRAADIARLRYREGVVIFSPCWIAEANPVASRDAVAESEKDVYVAVIATLQGSWRSTELNIIHCGPVR